jgi:hypothetical protein
MEALRGAMVEVTSDRRQPVSSTVTFDAGDRRVGRLREGARDNGKTVLLGGTV